MRRATKVRIVINPDLLISIHALREESDIANVLKLNQGGISIHALREESDRVLCHYIRLPVKFQSTLSVRRATKLATQIVRTIGFQSTLSVRRAT